MREPVVLLVNEDEVIENIEKNTIRNLRNMNLEGEARIASLEAIIESMRAEKKSCEAENAHLRQELARLKESANKDRAALNLIEDALRGRGRE